MCWVSRTLLKQVAEKDITIYKVCKLNTITNLLSSYFYSKPYSLNVLYQEPFSDVNVMNNEYQIYEGLHCYDERYKFTSKYDGKRYSEIIAMSRGKKFYYWGDVVSERPVIVKGYIPKGACYYVNEQGKIVSEAICLTEIINNVLDF